MRQMLILLFLCVIGIHKVLSIDTRMFHAGIKLTEIPIIDDLHSREIFQLKKDKYGQLLIVTPFWYASFDGYNIKSNRTFYKISQLQFEEGKAYYAKGRKLVCKSDTSEEKLFKAESRILNFLINDNLIVYITRDGVYQYDQLSRNSSVINDQIKFDVSDRIAIMEFGGNLLLHHNNILYKVFENDIEQIHKDVGFASNLNGQLYLYGAKEIRIYNNSFDLIRKYSLDLELPLVNCLTTFNNQYWCGTDNGMFVFDKEFKLQQKVGFIEGVKNTLPGPEVKSLLADGNKTWIGTNAGLCYFKLSNKRFEKLNTFADLEANDIKSIIGHTDEFIYLIDQDGQVLKASSYNSTAEVFCKDSKAKFGILDQQGCLILYTDKGLIYLTKNGSLKQVILDQSEIKMIDVSGLYLFALSDNNQLLIFKLDDGFYKKLKEIDLSNLKFSILTISALHNDEILLGTQKQILKISVDSDHHEFINTEFAVRRGSKIWKINAANDSLIWVSDSQGLVQIDLEQKKVREYVFPDKEIYRLSELIIDKKGDCWATYDRGILHFAGDRSDIRIIKYNSLPVKFFGKKAIQHGIDYFFWGEEEVLKMNIVDEVNVKPVVNVFFSNVKINHRTLEEKSQDYKGVYVNDIEHLQLTHDENNIEIEIFSTELTEKWNTYYAYKLEGLSEKWNYLRANQKTIRYTNLPSGDYNLLVRATDRDGVWSDHFKKLKITIDKAWWKSSLFYVTMIILSLLSIALLWRIMLLRERKKANRKREEEIRHQQYEMATYKERLYVNLAHEFKTPLSLIVAPVKRLLSQSDVTQDQLKSELVFVNRAVDRLQVLINKSVKIETDNKAIEFTRQVVDLAMICSKVIELFASELKQDESQIQFISQINNSEILGSPEYLEDLICNLVSNAIKHGEKRGDVTIRLCESEKELILQVENFGKSIPKDEKTKVFDRHYHSQQSKNSSGIGLAYCKEIVSQHSGIISVHDNKPSGTIFRVQIPNIKKKPDKSIITEGITAVTKDSKETGNNSYRMLIVEDDRDLQEYLFGYFKNRFNCYVASNGNEALNMVKNIMPDVIVSDVMMPVMDGFEFCKRVKSNVEISHIPVILLTAKSGERNHLEGLNIGADIYFQKPFEINILDSQIKNLMLLRKQIKEQFQKRIKADFTDLAHSVADEQFIQKINEYIDSRLSENSLSIEGMAKDIGMSRSALFKKTRALTGLSPNEFIIKQRISKACILLEKTDLSIKEIANQVGYEDNKYFSRIFKKITEKTASEYRGNLKG